MNKACESVKSRRHLYAAYLPVFILAMLLIIGTGCIWSGPAPNPLAGWHLCGTQDPAKFDQAIVRDYQSYVETMPTEQRILVRQYDIFFFEDGTGEHAVRIEIPLGGVLRDHLIIYDKDNKREKVIKYSSGRYAS